MTEAESTRLTVALLTREFPPEIYGGAGVHVEYLAAQLAASVDVAVYCFLFAGSSYSHVRSPFSQRRPRPRSSPASSVRRATWRSRWQRFF